MIGLAVAQDAFPYTDSATGIQFSSQAIPEARTKGGLQFGVAFPPKLDKNEYIGHIVSRNRRALYDLPICLRLDLGKMERDGLESLTVVQ